MTHTPDAAWIEAAQNIAADVYESFGDMVELDLQLSIVPSVEASATNSCDRNFLDSLVRGDHLGRTAG